MRPGGVALDRLGAVRAAELGLVVGLEPGLAEEVVRQVALLLEVLELLGARRARCSRGTGRQRAFGVLPARLDDDLDAGQVVRPPR